MLSMIFHLEYGDTFPMRNNKLLLTNKSTLYLNQRYSKKKKKKKL